MGEEEREPTSDDVLEENSSEAEQHPDSEVPFPEVPAVAGDAAAVEQETAVEQEAVGEAIGQAESGQEALASTVDEEAGLQQEEPKELHPDLKWYVVHAI